MQNIFRLYKFFSDWTRFFEERFRAPRVASKFGATEPWFLLKENLTTGSVAISCACTPWIFVRLSSFAPSTVSSSASIRRLCTLEWSELACIRVLIIQHGDTREPWRDSSWRALRIAKRKKRRRASPRIAKPACLCLWEEAKESHGYWMHLPSTVAGIACREIGKLREVKIKEKKKREQQMVKKKSAKKRKREPS